MPHPHPTGPTATSVCYHIITIRRFFFESPKSDCSLWFFCVVQIPKRWNAPHCDLLALPFKKRRQNNPTMLRIWRRIRRCVHCCTRLMLRSPPGNGSSPWADWISDLWVMILHLLYFVVKIVLGVHTVLKYIMSCFWAGYFEDQHGVTLQTQFSRVEKWWVVLSTSL